MVWVIEGSRSDGQTPFKYELTEDEIVLGRGARSSVPLNSLAVSRQHCCLFKRQTSWFVKDLNTKNGTEVNGKKLEPHVPHLLKSGDCVKVAALHDDSTSFQFRIRKSLPQIIDSDDDDESISPPAEMSVLTKEKRVNGVKGGDVVVLSSGDENENPSKIKEKSKAFSRRSVSTKEVLKPTIKQDPSSPPAPTIVNCIGKVKTEKASRESSQLSSSSAKDYSQDDVIIIDSDHEDDLFSPVKKKEPCDELEKESNHVVDREPAADDGDADADMFSEDDSNYLSLKWPEDDPFRDEVSSAIKTEEKEKTLATKEKNEIKLRKTKEQHPVPSTSGIKPSRKYDIPSESSSSSSEDEEEEEEEDHLEEPIQLRKKRKLGHGLSTDNQAKLRSPSSPSLAHSKLESKSKKILEKPLKDPKVSKFGKMKFTEAAPLARSRAARPPTIYQPPSVKPPKNLSLREQIKQNLKGRLPQQGSNFAISGMTKNIVIPRKPNAATAKAQAAATIKSKLAAIDRTGPKSKPAVAKLPNKSRMGFLLEDQKPEPHPLDQLLPAKSEESKTDERKEQIAHKVPSSTESELHDWHSNVTFQSIEVPENRLHNNDAVVNHTTQKVNQVKQPVANKIPAAGHNSGATNRHVVPQTQQTLANQNAKSVDLPRAYQEVVAKQPVRADPRLARRAAPADPRLARTAVQQSTSDYLKQKRQEGKIKPRDSDYKIEDVIAAKRLKHQNDPVKAPAQQPPERVVTGFNGPAPPAPRAAEAARARPDGDFIPLSTVPVNTVKPASHDEILFRVLSWNTVWIRQCLDQSEPPPVSTPDEPKTLKMTYESVEEYFKMYTPLILHEMWAQIMEKHQAFSENEVTVMAMKSYGENGDFMHLQLYAAVPKNHVVPGEGDLVVIELHPITVNEKQQEVVGKLRAFAYICELSVDNITSKTTVPDHYKIPSGSSLLVKCELRMKRRHIRLDPRRYMRVRSLLYIRPMLRNVEALFSLKNSTLCQDILKPRALTTCRIVCPTAVELQSSEYNESQFRAITGSLEAISRPFTLPKLLMIQGPPGTGKTHTLIGIIKNIFIQFAKSEKTPKLLVCAPSNGAIDEIAKRLHNERRFLMKHRNRCLRLVRIGQPSHIHPDVKVISLDQLVESNISSREHVRKKEFDDKIASMEQKIARLDQDIANHRVLGDIEDMRKGQNLMHRLYLEIKSLQEERDRGDAYKSLEAKKRGMRMDILRNADVVLSTLNSCRQNSLEHIFNAEKAATSFNCVIVDEASQCTEPEILMPLTYFSISKMILIGDPMQLPATVISKLAAQCKYGRSLFERFFNLFRKEKESPVLMLDTQYRMHPSICEFPSKRFYDNMLKSCPSLAQRKFPMRPYVVFNVQDSLHNVEDKKNLFNELEATFVAKLCTCICDLVTETTSIGIITPYQGQKRLLERKVRDMKLKNEPQINTIDGFQGQEKDIIIISCVRAARDENSSVGFLNSNQRVNVALTRAKKALILCISAQTLKSNELWNALIEDAKRRQCYVDTASTCGIEKLKRAYLKAKIVQL